MKYFLMLANKTKRGLYRHFIKDLDLTPTESLAVVKVARQLKSVPDRFSSVLKGEAIGLYFEKPSLRTRVSSETACALLGAHPVVLRNEEVHFHRGETPRDAANVLGGYLSLLLGRVYKQSLLEELASADALSIVNGLSDRYHPLQALADLLTIYEAFNTRLEGLKVTYLGDGNNVASSLALTFSRLGLETRFASPKGYTLPESIIEELSLEHEQGEAIKNIRLFSDPHEAVRGAHVIYTDVWTSMGQEGEESERVNRFLPFQVNANILKEADKDCIVMHCLPAHFDEEITREVFSCRASRIIHQAHNRLPATAALFLLMLRREMFYALADLK